MNVNFLKNLAFGLTVTLILLILIEMVLWAAGVTPLYHRTDTSVGFAGYAPLFEKHTEPNGKDIYQTAPNKLQWFNMQRFPAKKAEGIIRIFCLGGSTTYGRPYDDRTSFSGWLRLLLPAIDSSKRWEVINAGGISYASYRVARLMEEFADYEPDLFIVYTGHNEFLESRTYENLLKVPDFVRSLSVQASRTRIYSLLNDIIYQKNELLPTEVNALLDHSVGPEDYYRDDEKRMAVLGEYKKSLFQMANLSKQYGTQMIFITPASNIKDFSPFKSEPDNMLSTYEMQKVDTIKESIMKALNKGNYLDAKIKAEEVLAIDRRDPELLFLYAKALHALGLTEKAYDAFNKSKDEDICPLRALTPMYETVTEVAQTKNTGYVDFVKIVNQHSPDGIPGSELFLDHVHPTLEANRMLALAIIQEMKRKGVVSDNATWDENLVSEITTDLENSLDEKAHAIALRNLSRVLTWAGKHEEAERLINLAAEMIPDDSETHIQKGVLLWRDGKREEALIEYLEAKRLNPANASLHQRIGILLSELNRMPEAKAALVEAIRLDPGLSGIHYDLGIVLESLGNLKQAETSYRKAIEQDPRNAMAYNNLGVILAKKGDFENAYEQFAKALELKPDYKEAAKNLAQARMVLDQHKTK